MQRNLAFAIVCYNLRTSNPSLLLIGSLFLTPMQRDANISHPALMDLTLNSGP